MLAKISTMWKLANISWHTNVPSPPLPPEMKPEEQTQEFHTDDACDTTQVRLVLLIGWSN